MSAQFCIGCGKPLASGAQFCVACGAAVAGASGATAGGGSAPSAAPLQFDTATASGSPSAQAPPDPSVLRAALGLEGKRSFLLQHEMMSGGRNYRVLDPEKRHLFTVREGALQDLVANLGGGMRMREGFNLTGRQLAFHWAVADAGGNAQGAITIEVSGNTAVSTLADSAGTPLLAVTVQRSMMGGLTAAAASPDGRSRLEAKGNLLRHNFSIHDSSGAEVAKVHEAWASVRDTFNLDLVGNVEPLLPLIFAMMIDREKQAQ